MDRDGTVVGSAPRSVVRRDNLLHASTAVLVRDSEGRIYVHRRADDKDWAPSHHDCCAGGVGREWRGVNGPGHDKEVLNFVKAL